MNALPDRVDCVIVGAGYAGLATAAALQAAGVRVVIVEARDRVGGRAWTQELGRGKFDVGGQWIGPGQDRLAAVAARLGVATFPTFCAGDKLLDDGDKLSTYKGTIPSLGPLELAELHFALRRLDRLSARVSARDPAGSPHAARLDALTVADHARRIRSARVRAALEVACGSIFGVEPSEMSLLWFLAYLRAGGGFMNLCEIEGGAQERRFVGGAGGLAETWAAQLGCVVTSAPARRIAQRGDEVVVTTDRGAVAASRAVIAVPPQLAARIELEPSPPSRREQLVQRAGMMGAIVKLVITYERPFWRERGRSGEVVCLRPAPAAVVFDNCTHDLRQPALMAFVQGEPARRWTGDTGPVLGQLARWFGDEARHPSQVVSVDWAAERWSGGCPVAVAGPRALTTTGTTLREPIGRVHFAGTETATEWTGYLEGALESGERAAREVLRGL